MLKYVVPKIKLTDLTAMIRVSLVGAAIAGAYGILHDQITYSISPEYFTKLKFQQFQYAHFGLSDRVFVAIIGFLATWWVGGIGAWFLARRLIPGQPRCVAHSQTRSGFLCILAFGFSFGLAAYCYGLWRGPDADYYPWRWAIRKYQIEDTWAFVRVGYIHNGSYLGGLIGLIVALIAIRPAKREANMEQNRSSSPA